MLLYRISLRFYPLTRRLLALLPADAQNALKTYVRRKLASGSMAGNVSSQLAAGIGEITVAGLKRDYLPGANVYGYIKGDLGLGVHARSCLHALQAQQVPLTAVNFTLGLQHSQSDQSCSHLLKPAPDRLANILCLNADALMLCRQEQPDWFAGRYNIHYAAWELAHYPDAWMPAMNLVQELWTISTFMQGAASASSTVPVINIGIPVENKAVETRGRAFFDLPERRFLFLFSYDISSMTERKNPQAALNAFAQAFPPANHEVGLVVKINFIPDRPGHVQKLRELKEAWKHDSRIIFFDRVLTHPAMLSLIQCCDAYISLHRAEGFGLGIAEAMLLEKPVIVTNYSGNTDFTRPHNACLVNYTLVSIPAGHYIFEQGQVWAEADTAQAARYMRQLTEDSALYARLAKAGHATIANEFSNQAIGEKIRQRLALLKLV